MSVDSGGINWRLIGESKHPESRKFKPRNRIDYKVLVMLFVKRGNNRLAKLAREAARHANQLEDNDDGN